MAETKDINITNNSQERIYHQMRKDQWKGAIFGFAAMACVGVAGYFGYQASLDATQTSVTTGGSPGVGNIVAIVLFTLAAFICLVAASAYSPGMMFGTNMLMYGMMGGGGGFGPGIGWY